MNQNINQFNQSISSDIGQNYSFYNQGSGWYDYSSNSSLHCNSMSSPSILGSSPQSSFTYSSPETSYYYPYYTQYFPQNNYYSHYNNNSICYPNSDSSEKNDLPSFSLVSETNDQKVSTFETNFYFTPEKNSSFKRSKIQRKQLLPDSAVDIMNEWFDDHFNNPYPTLEEKERMAKQGGITVKQVTAWFSNRRNRSQNTKPKRIRRAIEQEMNTMIDQLTYNPNKIEIIEKLKTLF